MVVQRDQPVTVWGAAAADSQLAISFGSHKTTAKAGADGQWRAELPASAAGGPFELTVSGDGGSKVFKNVMVGDVWLAAGQSNMVMTLAASAEWAGERAAAPLPLVRVCKLPGGFSFAPENQYPRPLKWEELAPPRVANYFSGVAYFFARGVQPEINIPLGIVQASAGGTQAEQWTAEDDLKASLPDNPLFADRDKAKAKQDAGGKVGASEAGAAALFNGTLHPLRHAKFAGVLWYQGEANTRSKRDYRPVLLTMISSWRKFFGEPRLPFVIIQLPKFGLPKDDGWMRVQEAQLLVCRELDLPLVVTVDEGSAETIHPANKKEIGRRAALAALQKIYGRPADGGSPAPVALTVSGGALTVEFGGFDGDLAVRGEKIAGFELAGADGQWHPAEAKLSGRRVTVSAAAVPSPSAVRYLWANSPELVTLYSAAGFPATPFRSNGPGAALFLK